MITSSYRRWNEDEEPVSPDSFVLKLTQVQMAQLRAMYAVSERHGVEMISLGQCILDATTQTIKLVKFWFPKQKGTSTHTQVDKADMAKMIMKGIRVNVWIHTHPNMEAFWSATDEAMCRRLCGKAEYSLSIVLGQNDRLKIRLDISKPVNFCFDVDYVVDMPKSNNVIRAMEAVYKAKVTEEVYPAYQTPAYNPPSYNPPSRSTTLDEELPLVRTPATSQQGEFWPRSHQNKEWPEDDFGDGSFRKPFKSKEAKVEEENALDYPDRSQRDSKPSWLTKFRKII